MAAPVQTKLDAYRIWQRDPARFSRDVIGTPLYRYQRRWVTEVFSAIAEHRNEVMVIEMPRQSGKNEASAQLEVATLARFAPRGGEIVKAAPTYQPQIINSKLRFQLRAEKVPRVIPSLKFTPQAGYMFRCGLAGISFLSAAPGSSVVGATASLALEVDEAQDVEPAKFDKDFAPMRASTGAPLIAYGTTWTDDTLLERFKQDVLEGRVAGKVYRVTPEEVGEENPAYWEYVQGEVARLGRQHPLIRTQYYLEALPQRGRLLSPQQLGLLVGEHGQRDRRTGERIIVAGLDFAGADEDAGEVVSLLRASSRDSVALTIGELEHMEVATGIKLPKVKVLARYEFVNVHPLSLHTTLVRLLEDIWHANLVHCDATGIGATGTAMLSMALDGGKGTRVVAAKFDSAWSTQTRLVTQYIELINGSRLLDYQPRFDGPEVARQEVAPADDIDRHAWWQRGHARLQARETKRMRAYVPESEGHDDLLVSEMLMVDAASAFGIVGEVKQVQRKGWE